MAEPTKPTIWSRLQAMARPGTPENDRHINEIIPKLVNTAQGFMGTTAGPKGMGGLINFGAKRQANIAKQVESLLQKRQSLNQVGNQLREVTSQLTSRQRAIEMSLDKFTREIPDLSRLSDSQIRFKLGKDRYEIYTSMLEQQKVTRAALMKVNETYQAATRSYSTMYEEMQKLLGEMEPKPDWAPKK